jgi:hypothetical protein
MTQVVVAQSEDVLQWPDTFAMDESGAIYVTSNKLQRFFTVGVVLYRT